MTRKKVAIEVVVTLRQNKVADKSRPICEDDPHTPQKGQKVFEGKNMQTDYR